MAKLRRRQEDRAQDRGKLHRLPYACPGHERNRVRNGGQGHARNHAQSLDQGLFGPSRAGKLGLVPRRYTVAGRYLVPGRTAMLIVKPLARLTLAGMTALAAFGTLAVAQGSKSQVVMLPDHTPRQPDLEQKYSQPAVSGTAADHAAMVLNEQRQALIIRASSQLASLAAVLNDGIQKHE